MGRMGLEVCIKQVRGFLPTLQVVALGTLGPNLLYVHKPVITSQFLPSSDLLSARSLTDGLQSWGGPLALATLYPSFPRNHCEGTTM